MTKALLVLMGLMMTTTVFAGEMTQTDAELAVMEARIHLAAGDTEKARQIAEPLLISNAENASVKQLMSDIIDSEIAHDPNPSQNKEIEELSAKERQLEVERWLERARTLRQYGQYEQAALAAEKVFTFDAQNAQASRLRDEIQRDALKEGVRDMAAVNRSAKEEAKARIQTYLTQASGWMKSGRVGAAMLALDKVLVLDPGNDEAVNLKKQIRKHLDDEKRKTF